MEDVTTTENVTENQTTSAPAETSQPENVNATENQTTENAAPKPEAGTDTTVTDGADGAEAPQKNWEQIAKDNQASFTRVSQELAELKKQVEANKPQLVKEGHINPDFEQKYRYDVDNREFLTFDNLARQLEPEARADVEKLLRQAQSLYNPRNKAAYEAKLNEVKDYFRSDIVEQIALDKRAALNKMDGEFQKALSVDIQKRAQASADEIEQQAPELFKLVDTNSDSFSPEMLSIVKTMFDATGGVDIRLATKAIEHIKNIAVKEYLAQQSAEKARGKASVPTGGNVLQKNTSSYTRDELVNNPALYAKAAKELGGMDKVDEIIMKG